MPSVLAGGFLRLNLLKQLRSFLQSHRSNRYTMIRIMGSSIGQSKDDLMVTEDRLLEEVVGGFGVRVRRSAEMAEDLQKGLNDGSRREFGLKAGTG